MSEYKVGDKVCFLGGHSLPEFFGGVYEVIGQTIAGIFNDEYVLNDKGKTMRVSYKSIRPAKSNEIKAGFREGSQEFDNYWYGRSEAEEVKAMELLNDMGDDFPIESHISPMCEVKDV
ncbi:hypothetical protein [Acinetobacter baumannii]|uniref:hypothetical protein n=1 Tax=Acinetobacter baumannii TaxID=470 RepID=UPI0024DDFE76|nr:hypothetical protein [Acinetobacter baumannii]MDK2143695.1 hypothetical protein [Acinetobacter baumannii]MDK2162244.1 hypothetical protein [Acinetobacter baumannii]MDK2173347.1 hypothetical protein [Acinetobacter baumannii]MDK2202279.1 hypothetical protein [Acinetobacter baumannii]MDK2209420.1 hypothetical protein [Acinetobacter baumannii]